MKALTLAVLLLSACGAPGAGPAGAPTPDETEPAEPAAPGRAEVPFISTAVAGLHFPLPAGTLVTGHRSRATAEVVSDSRAVRSDRTLNEADGRMILTNITGAFREGEDVAFSGGVGYWANLTAPVEHTEP